jgi:hypothetical protein
VVLRIEGLHINVTVKALDLEARSYGQPRQPTRQPTVVNQSGHHGIDASLSGSKSPVAAVGVASSPSNTASQPFGRSPAPPRTS